MPAALSQFPMIILALKMVSYQVASAKLFQATVLIASLRAGRLSGVCLPLMSERKTRLTISAIRHDEICLSLDTWCKPFQRTSPRWEESPGKCREKPNAVVSVCGASDLSSTHAKYKSLDISKVFQILLRATVCSIALLALPS